MNERIKELYKEATGKDWVYDFDPDVAEKFAKMIAQDCISQIALIGISNDEHEDVLWAAEKAVNMIKERYRIES